MTRPQTFHEKEKENTLTLMPGDFIQLAVGLKIENTTKDMVLMFELPAKCVVKPVVYTSGKELE